MSAHDHCLHEKTKSARAKCRRETTKGLSGARIPNTPAVKPQPTDIQTPIASTHTERALADVTVREIRLSAQIDAYQLAMTREKVDKINARAERKGLAGTLSMTVEPIEMMEHDKITKLERFWTEYKVEVTGNAPAYNGWEFIAKLDWDQHAGLIVRAVPGVSGVDRESVREGWCDHCQTMRRRNVTYVVRNQETGETLQVGSSCLKDFTGQYTTIAFPELDSPDDDRDGFWGITGVREYTPETILAVAWACIKLDGFKPASLRDGKTTRDDVMTALYPSKSRNDREFAALIAPLAEEANEKAREILAFILSDDFTTKADTDYVPNLKAVAAGKAVSVRNIGILASAPQAWARHQEQTLTRERETSVYAKSEFIGTAPDKENGVKGSRLDLVVEVKAIRYIHGDWGVRTLYTMVTQDECVVKWFASGVDTLGETPGGMYRIRGTVKSHETYRDNKSTVLTRCQLLDVIFDPDAKPAAE